MADDPSPITRWVVNHPWGWGLVAATVLILQLRFSFPDEWWPYPVGVVFGLVNAFIWRANGPAQRLRAYMLRRFPKK